LRLSSDLDATKTEKERKKESERKVRDLVANVIETDVKIFERTCALNALCKVDQVTAPLKLWTARETETLESDARRGKGDDKGHRLGTLTALWSTEIETFDVAVFDTLQETDDILGAKLVFTQRDGYEV